MTIFIGCNPTTEELAQLERELDFSHGVVSVRPEPLKWWEYLWPGTWARGFYRFLEDLYSR